MESRITGVTAPADERKSYGEGEKLWWEGKKNKSVQQDEDLLVHSRPDPADLPSVPLFALCSWRPRQQPTSGSPYGKEGIGVPESLNLILPSSFVIPQDLRRHNITKGGIPYCGVPAPLGLITAPKEGKNFGSKDAEAHVGSFLLCEIF